jgi:hypothetical protein
VIIRAQTLVSYLACFVPTTIWRIPSLPQVMTASPALYLYWLVMHALTIHFVKMSITVLITLFLHFTSLRSGWYLLFDEAPSAKCQSAGSQRNLCPYVSLCAPVTSCLGGNQCGVGYKGSRCSVCESGEDTSV